MLPCCRVAVMLLISFWTAQINLGIKLRRWCRGGGGGGGGGVGRGGRWEGCRCFDRMTILHLKRNNFSNLELQYCPDAIYSAQFVSNQSNKFLEQMSKMWEATTGRWQTTDDRQQAMAKAYLVQSWANKWTTFLPPPSPPLTLKKGITSKLKYVPPGLFRGVSRF